MEKSKDITWQDWAEYLETQNDSLREELAKTKQALAQKETITDPVAELERRIAALEAHQRSEGEARREQSERGVSL